MRTKLFVVDTPEKLMHAFISYLKASGDFRIDNIIDPMTHRAIGIKIFLLLDKLNKRNRIVGKFTGTFYFYYSNAYVSNFEMRKLFIWYLFQHKHLGKRMLSLLCSKYTRRIGKDRKIFFKPDLINSFKTIRMVDCYGKYFNYEEITFLGLKSHGENDSYFFKLH